MLLFKGPLFTLPSNAQILPALTQISSLLKSVFTVEEQQIQSQSSLDDVSRKIFRLIEDDFLDKNALESVVYCRRLEPVTRKLSNHWNTSYLSQWSFDENKYGHKLMTFNSNLLKNVNTTSFLCKRTFKSQQRSAEFVGLGSKRKTESDSKIASFLKLRTQSKSEKESEKLKEILSDENLSAEEQQRVKVAFAEGYAAAGPKRKAGGKVQIFHVIRDLLGIVFILVVLSSLLGEISGGPFKRFIIGGGSEVHSEEIDVTFDDVKGVDEAKQELQEVVEFLKNPEKFSALGGKLPKGVLLVGPPGTGKTLLARAVAGEAGVPFFHAAGPEFDEILVGQGARRVRDLFNAAKIRAPCVIFIDEIDSVGAKRTNSVLHPYANQTINQLLTEMDGFRQNEGVVVLGATNRRDDLDKALLRPGRFDVEVQVPVPDVQGRVEILKLYLGKVKMDRNVDVDVLARRTTGFTGADIENMVNQAALRAAIDGAKTVTMKYFENARDKVLMGPERKSRIPDEEANRITAYHESGHALVAYYTKDATPIHKVTIVSRGPSLGHTAYIPEKESYHITKAQMEAWIDAAMGGRAAEELIFGSDKVTSGSFSDLKEATGMATRMVKDFGMSDKVGFRTFEEDKNNIFGKNELSDNTADVIDTEIKRILQESYERAKNILKTHSKEHKLVAEALLKYETLDFDDLKAVLQGNEPKMKHR